MSPEKSKHIQLRHMREKNCLVNPLWQKIPFETERCMESFWVNKQLNVGLNIMKISFKITFYRVILKNFFWRLCNAYSLVKKSCRDEWKWFKWLL